MRSWGRPKGCSKVTGSSASSAGPGTQRGGRSIQETGGAMVGLGLSGCPFRGVSLASEGGVSGAGRPGSTQGKFQGPLPPTCSRDWGGRDCREPSLQGTNGNGGSEPPSTCVCTGGALQGPGQLNSGGKALQCPSLPTCGVPPGRQAQGSGDPVFYGVFLCRRRRPAFVRPGEGWLGGSAPAFPQSAGAQGRPCRKADSLPNFSPGS